MSDSWRDDPAVKKWLGRLKPGRRGRNHASNLSLFKAFYEYVTTEYVDAAGERPFEGFTPSMLVNFQADQTSRGRYLILDALIDHVNSVGGTPKSMQRRMATARGLFMHNRAPLPRDKVSLKPTRPPTQGELTAADVRDVVLASNPTYQAVFMVMMGAALDEEMFTTWNLDPGSLGDLRAQMKPGEDLIKVELPGRKLNRNKKPYYTFFGGDALEKLRSYWDFRPGDARHIFVTQYGTPLEKRSLYMYWNRKMVALGKIRVKGDGFTGNRYGLHVHEMRDVFRSLWSLSPAKKHVGEFVMGHNIDPLEYDKSWREEWAYREEYLKALPYLNVLSSPDPYGLVSRDTVEGLRVQIGTRDKQIDLLSRDVVDLKAQVAGLQPASKQLEVLEALTRLDPDVRDLVKKLTDKVLKKARE